MRDIRWERIADGQWAGDGFHILEEKLLDDAVVFLCFASFMDMNAGVHFAAPRTLQAAKDACSDKGRGKWS